MKVRVKFSISDRNIDEIIESGNSESLLATAKDRVASELGWKGMFLSLMTPIQFAQLAVSKYNENFGTQHALPNTGSDFIKFGLETGTVEVLEP